MAPTTVCPQPHLDRVPPELIERIAENLDLPSICNLRLTCKVISNRSYGPRFLSFFRQQKTDLTSKSLQRLCQITTHPLLRSAVESLTVLAVVYHTSKLDDMLKTGCQHTVIKEGVFFKTKLRRVTQEELDEARANREELLAQMQKQKEMTGNMSDVQLLTDALGSLGKLATLKLEAAIAQDPSGYTSSSSVREWHPVWIRAVQVYRIVMLAMGRSGIAVKNLRIYKASQRCSVPTYDIHEHMPALEASNFAEVAKYIKSVSLSVSTKVDTDMQKIAEARANLPEVDLGYHEAGMGSAAGLLTEDDPSAVAVENYLGVARLLEHMRDLKNLDLHLYRTLKGSMESYAKIFSYLVDDILLSSLRHCTFRGLYCFEASLLTFLRNHNAIVTLEMREIHLVSGSWTPVFAHMCTLPYLKKVTLQDIWTPEKRKISLASKYQSQEINRVTAHSYPCGDGTMVHTRTFSQDEIRKEQFEFGRTPEKRQRGVLTF